MTQIAGNVAEVLISPKPDKSSGTITIYYNGSTTLPTAIGTYTVTFDVAKASGWKAATGLAGGSLIIDNPIPSASDFDIGNRNQIYGSVTPITITPQFGKSTGAVTIRYNGSTALPTAVGTYTITFDIAAAPGWNAVAWLLGGTLTINPKPITITGVTATNRIYDGTTTVALSGGLLIGVINNDAVSFEPGTGTIANASAGNNKAVATNIQLIGNDKNSYALTQPGNITVTITALEGFSLSFADFSDITAPAITAGTIHLIGGTGKPTSTDIVLANAGQYDTGSIKWYSNGNLITSGISGIHGEILTVNSTTYNRIGQHSVTVEVKINSKLYSKIIAFEVRP